VSYPNYASGGAGDENSHLTHAGTNNINCGEWHQETSTVGAAIDGTVPANHVNQTVDVVLAQGGTFLAGTCTTTYCHGAGTPQWGGTVACGDCHAANNTIAGSHAQHYESATQASDRSAANNSTAAEYLINCGVCHFNAPHAQGAENANRTAQVIFDGTIGTGTHTEGGSSQVDPVTGFDWTNATCSTSYCHGNFGGNGNIATPTWGDAVSGDCGTCHDVDTSPTMTGGSHQVHAK
jgi:predicted CxxxxCH...CXXCH cytochrome family protein